jgi:hypothetical protein
VAGHDGLIAPWEAWRLLASFRRFARVALRRFPARKVDMHLEEELVGLLEGEIVRDLVAGALARPA